MSSDSAYYRIYWKHVRGAVLVIAACIALIMLAISRTVADVPRDSSPVATDGRINVVHHFGGDVLYCVDENYAPTNEFFTDNNGGFELLNINGEPLWFVEAETVLAKVAEAFPGGPNVLVAEGQGTYGSVALYTYKVNDIVIRFIFVGMDEHGKTNQIDFEGCTPVNPPAGGLVCTTSAINGAFTEDEDLEVFFTCYERTCPGININDVPAAPDCFCAVYPNSIPCGGGERETPG